jgi:hypothetical protein
MPVTLATWEAEMEDRGSRPAWANHSLDAPHLQNNQSKRHWRYNLSDKGPVLPKKKKKKRVDNPLASMIMGEGREISGQLSE